VSWCTLCHVSRRDNQQQDGQSSRQTQIAEALVRMRRTAAAAESLTGGNISAALSAIEGASDWFLGGVVAYAEEIKYALLGVDRGPVINARSAVQMAEGVARLLDADFAVATTGVGGPAPQEDIPQGTVYVAVVTPDRSDVREYRFDGDPGEVVAQATRQALDDLAAAVALRPADAP
jgi:nicotinamide-nucleotide amidase